MFSSVHHLVGSAEIGILLGVSRQRVHQLTRRADFPEPEVKLATGRVWKRADVEAWARTRGRLIYGSEPGGGQ